MLIPMLYRHFHLALCNMCWLPVLPRVSFFLLFVIKADCLHFVLCNKCWMSELFSLAQFSHQWLFTQIPKTISKPVLFTSYFICISFSGLKNCKQNDINMVKFHANIVFRLLLEGFISIINWLIKSLVTLANSSR